MRNIPQVWLKHCFREAKCCSDALAKIGANMQDGFVVFDSPPSVIATRLYSDKLGVTQDRVCNSVVAITQFNIYNPVYLKKKKD